MINSTITPPVENRYNRESICLIVSKTLPIFSTEHNLKSTRGTGYSNATKRINQFHRQPTLNHFVVRHVSITCLSINVFKGITPLRFIEFYHSTWALRVNRTVRLDSRTNCFSSSLSLDALYTRLRLYTYSLSRVSRDRASSFTMFSAHAMSNVAGACETLAHARPSRRRALEES